MKRINFPTAINSSSPQRLEPSTMHRIKRYTMKTALTGKCHCSGRPTPRSARHPWPWRTPMLEGDLTNGKPVLPTHSLKHTSGCLEHLPHCSDPSLWSACGTSLLKLQASVGSRRGNLCYKATGSNPAARENVASPAASAHFPVNYL